jgi:RND family efflux transporter MFP subunit
LPVATLLEKLQFQQLVEDTLTVKRETRAMPMYKFVLGMVLALYVGFSRLHHLRFLAREPMLIGILEVLRLPPQCTFWRFLASLPGSVAQQLLEVQRQMHQRVWEAAHVQLREVTLDTDTTVHTVYGQQLGARKSYNPKNRGKKSYQPILTFLAETKEYVGGELHNGDRPTGLQISPASLHSVTFRNTPDTPFLETEAALNWGRRMRRIIVGSVVFGLVAIGIAVWRRFDVAHSQELLRSAEVVRATRRDIGTAVKATGVIKPMTGAEVNVGSSVSGVVMRLFVQIGDHVTKGQPLAELDSRTFTARRDADAAALRVAQANMEYAQVDLQRKRQLHAAQIIARSELDLAGKGFSVAEQQRDQAEAALAYSTTQLGYTQIIAPISGVVSAVSTQEGETVAASFAAPTFVTLLDLSRLEVWAYVDETDIGRIRIGQKARFTVDTYGDRDFHGAVTAIHPKAEIRDNVVDYVVVVRFTPPHDFVLRPEMTATVKVDLERLVNVLTLPIRAVRREGSRAFVLCRNAGKTEQRWVGTGIRDDSYWEIVGGLHEGDEVLMGDMNSQ